MVGTGKVRATLKNLVLAGVLAALVTGCEPERSKAPPPTSPSFQSHPDTERPTPDYEKRAADMTALLRREGMLESARVSEAIVATPRHLFVPEDQWHLAYTDMALPIGAGQTISAPGVVAKMTELLRPQPDDIVLEVGTGSGYQAAVLARLVKHVYTIEILCKLADSARERLRKLGYENVTVRCGDGYQGWPEHAPFAGIIVTCAPEHVPQPLQDQLKEGGRMVIPVGPESGAQRLYLLEKHQGAIVRTATLPVIFVPMTGEVQQH